MISFKDEYESAMSGDALAQSNVGCFFEKGIGVDQEFQKAIYWFKKSAEQGLDIGQYHLGVAYDSPEGGENFQQAVFWFQKAADHLHSRKIVTMKLL